jgi:phenylacetate-coenzyme A ligase PaaK-like adenylate-forming protein
LIRAAREPHEFAKLQPLSKTDLLENLWNIRVSNEFPFHVGLSSGTTADEHPGKLSIYLRDRDEVEFNRNLMWRQDIIRPRPLALRLFSAHHGGLFLSSLPGTFMMPIENEYQFSQVKTLLQSELDFKDCDNRVSILIAPSNYSKLLYCLCARDSILSSLAIRQVYGGGDRITPRWRRLLEQGFRAEVVESYGVSEVVSSIAPQCPACGFYHFRQTVFAELVSIEPRSDASNLGEILLTSLLPTTVNFPLLRYRSGDIALDRGHCAEANEVSYEILGRLTDSYVREEPFVCIPSGVVEDIIDDLPWVERRSFQPGESFGLSREIGLPQFRFAKDGTGRVTMALKSSSRFPALHTEALRRDCEEVRRRLVEEEEAAGRVAMSRTRLAVIADTW